MLKGTLGHIPLLCDWHTPQSGKAKPSEKKFFITPFPLPLLQFSDKGIQLTGGGRQNPWGSTHKLQLHYLHPPQSSTHRGKAVLRDRPRAFLSPATQPTTLAEEPLAVQWRVSDRGKPQIHLAEATTPAWYLAMLPVFFPLHPDSRMEEVSYQHGNTIHSRRIAP